MPLVDLPIFLVTQELDENVRLARALLFPEVVALHERADKLQAAVAKLAREVIARSPPIEVHRRVCPAEPVLGEVVIDVAPAARSAGWLTPLPLRFHVLRWRSADQTGSVAFVPALDLFVVSGREDEMEELVPRHIRFALARRRLTENLFELIQLDRVREVSVTREVITPDVRTPKRIAAEQDKAAEPTRPIIEEVGYELKDEAVGPAYEVDDLVERIAEALSGRNARSVLLIGPSGVGKTAAFGELFRRRRDYQMSHWPVWVTSGARLVAGQAGFGMWQARAQRLVREAHKAGALVHLGNLVELMEVGKAGGSNFGIASFLRPALARGDFLAVAECTPEQVPLIERANPHLLSVFEQIRVEEPSAESGRMILLAGALAWQADHAPARRGKSGEPAVNEPPITEAALEMLDRLHRRYATYSAAPGRPLRFLRNLLQDRQARRDATFVISGEPAPIGPLDVTAAFARETGLPLFLLDDETPLDLEAARRHFWSRVIGQAAAVDLVTDLLATVKSALNRPRRPIASLLFIGPTGVGKTEMAKALAAYFFGDATRLVRFDMSEFATPAAVGRLVGSAWEAEGLLTSKVREQPFCVVLLDEFEKAHPSFFDLLLQVLGEGRLTDSAGRLADFSNAIVIMTSNLGAQRFGAGPFGLSRQPTLDAAEHFTEAVRSFLRPELFNRIDRVVSFAPLDRETIRRIAAREIALIESRDGVRMRELSLSVSDAAVAHLADAGYDVSYGARPLKRAIERDLLSALADGVNQYGDKLKLAADVDVGGSTGAAIEVTVRAAAAGGTAPEQQPPSLAPSAARAADLRRRAQAIARCPAVLNVQNELFQLRRMILRKTAHPGRRFVDPAGRERAKYLTGIVEAVAKLGEDAARLEDELLLHVYESAPLSIGRGSIDGELSRLEGAAELALLRLFGLRYDDPDQITVGLFGVAHRDVFALASAYRRIALASGAARDEDAARVRVSWFSRQDDDDEKLRRNFIDEKDAEAFLDQPRRGVIGLALDVRAGFAAARFEGEAGLHVFEEERDRDARPVLVDTAAGPPERYRPPKNVEFRSAIVGQRRRTYVAKQQTIHDVTVGREYRWTARGFEEALAAAMAEAVRARTAGVIES
jgi:ATP-dependent Clp protease ATP-binding subunit ClpA